MFTIIKNITKTSLKTSLKTPLQNISYRISQALVPTFICFAHFHPLRLLSPFSHFPHFSSSLRQPSLSLNCTISSRAQVLHLTQNHRHHVISQNHKITVTQYLFAGLARSSTLPSPIILLCIQRVLFFSKPRFMPLAVLFLPALLCEPTYTSHFI